MKKSLFNKAITSVVAFIALVTVSSCVDKKFDLNENEIDLNVTVFQEGISLPLGSTGKLTLASLYDQLDSASKAMVKELEGAYMIQMRDTMNVANDVTGALSAIGSMSAVSLDEEFGFSLSSIDLSSLKIAGRPISMTEVDLSEMLSKLDVNEISEKLPSINEKPEQIKVQVPELGQDDLSIDIMEMLKDKLSRTTRIAYLAESIEMDSEILNNPLVSNLASREMNYEELRSAVSSLPMIDLDLPEMKTEFVFEEYEVEVGLEFVLPEQIKEVKSIQMHKDASFELSFEILNPLFTNGTVTPVLNVDLSDLLILEGADKGNVFQSDFPMNKENGWKATNVYPIAALAVEPGDWVEKDGCLTLSKTARVTMAGELDGEETLMTTLKHLLTAGQAPMEVKMDVAFHNFEIDDVQMEIKPIIPEIDPIEAPIEVPEINLGTDLVESIEYIAFDETSPVSLMMKAELPAAFEGVDVKLKNLQIEFPKEMVVDYKGTVGTFSNATNVLTYQNVSLVDGLADNIVIDKMNLPAIVDNKLSYSGKVKVTAEAAAEGIISSRKLIDNPGGEVTVDVQFSYAPKLKDYKVTIKDYEYKVAFDAVEINEPIAADLADLMKDGPILVSPKKDEFGNNPTIQIDLTYPQDPAINICGLAGEGLVVDLPDMLRFAPSSIKDSYNFNPDGNTMVFTENDKIPTEISLEIVNIAVQAVKLEGEEEKYAVVDRMEVVGGVRLAGTTLDKDAVGRLQNNEVQKVALNGNIPDIEPAQFGIDEYTKTVETSFNIEDIEIEVPETIKSIGIQDLLLKDVYLLLDVEAASLRELIGDADVTVKIEASLPSLLMVESMNEEVVVKDNVLTITTRLDDAGKVEVDGVKVVGIDFTNIKIEDGKLSLKLGEFPVVGTVTMKGLTVDMESLAGKDVKVNINGNLASVDEEGKATDKIMIDKINAKVGMDIEAVNTTISLESIASVLNGENMSFTPDINSFYVLLYLNTNIDVPIRTKIEVTPYFGSEPGQTRTPEIALDPQSRKDDCYNIFMSNINPNAPAEDRVYNGRYDIYKDYQFVDLDLLSMFYKTVDGERSVFADSIKLVVSAGIDKNKLSTIEPNKEYKLGLEYQVGVPFELGKKFEFSFRTVIDDLPEAAAQIFSYGSVGLGGSVANGFPLGLNLQVRPLDSNGDPIALKEDVGVLRIASCDAKGNPVVSKLNFVLSGEGADLSDMKSIELIFTASSEDAAGVPFGPESSIQVKLSALVPDGVTLDLGSLAQKSEEDEE